MSNDEGIRDCNEERTNPQSIETQEREKKEKKEKKKKICTTFRHNIPNLRNSMSVLIEEP